jgi:hypothetical protein
VNKLKINSASGCFRYMLEYIFRKLQADTRQSCTSLHAANVSLMDSTVYVACHGIPYCFIDSNEKSWLENE